jgi:septum formation protein
MSTTLYLASSSPRRKEILTGLGIPFTVVVRSVDETPLFGETPTALVLRLAKMKAEALREEFSSGYVIGADNTVELGGEIFGKPLDEDDACSMLMKFSGAVVSVHTGHALYHLDSGVSTEKLSTSEVHFKRLDESTLREYVKTGEPMDKSGSFAVQGIAKKFIEKTVGSITNIMGLDESVMRDWYDSIISKRV